MAGLLQHLQVLQVDLLGFSNGGTVTLQVAIRHPRLVRRLVFASSLTKREGAQPQLWEFIKQVWYLQHAAGLEGRVPGGHAEYLAEAVSAPTATDYAEITARLVERLRSEAATPSP